MLYLYLQRVVYLQSIADSRTKSVKVWIVIVTECKVPAEKIDRYVCSNTINVFNIHIIKDNIM